MIVLLMFPAVCLTATDYWSEDFDQNKNCVRETEMGTLRREPQRCASAGSPGEERRGRVGSSSDVRSGSARIQWEDCKRKLAEMLWLKCKPRNILKGSFNSKLRSRGLKLVMLERRVALLLQQRPDLLLLC